MWREYHRHRGISLQLTTHLLRHIYKAIHCAQIVMVAGFVNNMVFVRLYIIHLTDKLRDAIRASDACHRTKAGSHKRSPVLHQHHIGSLSL